ncbi:ferric reductase family protein [Aspergillus foveolatus]|uniref:ferric reductase family protein n=1 Tax=Aspergillus foveolatus TaxID=210207 RepID=UPI003CCD5E35
MDVVAIYAITAGGIFAALFLTRTLLYLSSWSKFFSILLWGPWTRISVLFHISYAAISILLIFFRIKSWAGAGRRAGELALVNLIFLLSAVHLSYLADLVGITWRTCRQIHRAVGWMTVALVSFHIVMEVQGKQFRFPLHSLQNFFTLIGTGSLGVLSLLSLPWIRQLSYEIFLRGHHILTVLFVYGIRRHLSTRSWSSKIYLLAALGMFGLTLFLQTVTLFYRNGLFAGRGFPRAVVSFSAQTKEEHPVITAAHIRVLLPRPLKVEAGQYINLWMPSVSLSSCMQTHPFTVASWSSDRQDTIDLLLQPRHGLTADLVRYAPTAKESSISFLALFTGPHGMIDDVSHYESVLVVTSGFGIAAAIPYLKKMIYGYDTCTFQVRRLHSVWEVKSVGKMAAALALLNNLLKDDIMDNGYILHISIYVRDGLEPNRFPFGEHDRVCLYQGPPDYQNIVSIEASGDQIERLSNIRDKQGKTLVMGECPNALMDYALKFLSSVRSRRSAGSHKTVREHLHQGMNLVELEYQPCAD